jgi:hypothetical protein
MSMGYGVGEINTRYESHRCNLFSRPLPRPDSIPGLALPYPR